MDGLQMTHVPVAETGMLIRKPVADVFEAFVDPQVTTKFWFTKSSGRLEAGRQVQWDWEMYEVSVPVIARVISLNERILIEWPGYGTPTTVEWKFAPLPDGTTFVSITESGFTGDGDALVRQVAASTEGFSLVLAGLKALLEQGVTLNLVADRYPKGIEPTSVESRVNGLIARLRSDFERWEQFLAGRTVEEPLAPGLAGGWSTREVLLHLMAWQQVSIARLQAVLRDEDPRLPSWLGDADPFYADEHADEFNARILEQYRAESWSSVHREWRDGFQHFLVLAQAVPEEKMFDAQRYPWLQGLAPADVISGSCDHHEEHLQASSA